MTTTHFCLTTYYVRDLLGEIRPIFVKENVVPGLKYDLSSVKGLNQLVYVVQHRPDTEESCVPDPEESGVHATINKKIDKPKQTNILVY